MWWLPKPEGRHKTCPYKLQGATWAFPMKGALCRRATTRVALHGRNPAGRLTGGREM